MRTSTVLLPARDGDTGHRVSVMPGTRPVRTRDLPWQAKLAEYPNRWLARAIARHPERFVFEVPDRRKDRA